MREQLVVHFASAWDVVLSHLTLLFSNLSLKAAVTPIAATTLAASQIGKLLPNNVVSITNKIRKNRYKCDFCDMVVHPEEELTTCLLEKHHFCRKCDGCSCHLLQ